ncbi:MAG: hypothetical protein ACYSUX_19490 [Planctomycetota bacterium]|jgi:hypothetical protein
MSNQCRKGDLHSDSPELKRSPGALKETDFELAYLAALTCTGLKPLSRWEKPLADGDLELLQRTGLLTSQVRRTVKSGKEIVETIFSRAPVYIRLYEQAFGNTPIDKTARTQLFEGFLFGYPSCCVNHYIHKPYAPNNLTDQEQKILFHWACRGCEVTPALLPAYKSVHDSIDHC